MNKASTLEGRSSWIRSVPYLIGGFIVLRVLLPALTDMLVFALVIFSHQLFLLIKSLGEVVPVRYLFGALMSLQMLVGPVIAYAVADEFVLPAYRMRVPEAEYFSFVIPAVIAFLIGLHIFDKNNSGERLNMAALKDLKIANAKLPYYFIAFGFAGMLLRPFFPQDVAFVLYLIGCLQYAGVFLLILSSDKFPKWPVLAVYGFLVIISVTSGMFHDLLLWLIFLAAVLLLKYKVHLKFKLLFGMCFIILAMVIQSVKLEFRDALSTGADANLETIGNVLEQNEQVKGGIFSTQNLSLSSVRINQGFILSNIMVNVPANLPYENGATLNKILFSAIFPRFLFKDKLNAGDQEMFMKYTGMRINQNTAMALSSIGDGYVNFGKTGAVIFMFFYGLLFNLCLRFFQRRSYKMPAILIFIPLIFVYPVRPDCELQTILGHLIKSSFLVLVISNIFKKHLTVKYEV